jgi:hypothetical protein
MIEIENFNCNNAINLQRLKLSYTFTLVYCL